MMGGGNMMGRNMTSGDIIGGYMMISPMIGGNMKGGMGMD